jgi:endonuclease/exonuclease/phosphatase (EEP) superfamily protein YafD
VPKNKNDGWIGFNQSASHGAWNLRITQNRSPRDRHFNDLQQRPKRQRFWPLLGMETLMAKQTTKPPSKRGRMRTIVLLMLGQAMAFLFVAVMARLLFYDRALMLIWFNLFTVYLYLPAYLIFAVSLVMHEKALAIAAVAIILFHLVLIVPPLIPRADFAETVPTGEVVRLFNANLLFTNTNHEAMIAEIEQADADILLFQEYTSAWDAAFSRSWMDEAYPYRFLNIIDSPFGSGIWSKRPLTDTTIWSTEGVPMVQATIQIDGQPVRLHDIHPPPPMKNYARWARIQDDIRKTAVDESIPVMIVGDFNMGSHNRFYKNILDQGFYSLHQELGRGLAISWPNGLRNVPPVQLDHIFVSAELVGLSINEGIGSGSDHKPLIADVALAD